VMLSDSLLADLRNYFKAYRPKYYLFEGQKKMDHIEKKVSFQRAEKRLQHLIDQLEDRLRKTDQATTEAQDIRKQLEKLKEKK
ncbi:MAG: hypothetical protein AAF734_11240, partial [Bacteroidota bacterium]